MNERPQPRGVRRRSLVFGVYCSLSMRLCFIIEEQYRRDSMPLVVARQLLKWGHAVDLLEPSKTATSLCDLTRRCYDAYVLKTVSDGPGLCILQAAEAVGIPTINASQAIRLVRDKTIFTALAHAHGLPVPRSYFIAHPRLLRKIPQREYPLVVKPTNGSSGRGIYRVNTPDELATLQVNGPSLCFFLAQHYVENPGYDIKLYVIGQEVYAVARKSPLHTELDVLSRRVSLKPEWLRLARQVGELFGLDIYGLDVLETRDGPVVVDINDFPSFEHVPGAVSRIANYILQLAGDSKFKRPRPFADRVALKPVSPQRLVWPAGNGVVVPAGLSRAAKTGLNHARRNGHWEGVGNSG